MNTYFGDIRTESLTRTYLDDGLVAERILVWLNNGQSAAAQPVPTHAVRNRSMRQ